MYELASTCQICGAPIYAKYNDKKAPTTVFSCECRNTKIVYPYITYYPIGTTTYGYPYLSTYVS